jgi:hypothetical protein
MRGNSTFLSSGTSVLVTMEVANEFSCNFVRALCKMNSYLYCTLQFNKLSSNNMTVSEAKKTMNTEILFRNIYSIKYCFC